MTLSQSQIKAFQKEILMWYSHHQRDLPWRKDRDPYHILVSEVMLQQTQVQRVIPKYEAWLKVFPNLEFLANASIRDVLLHWSGLGYNRRALYLQKLAKEVLEKFNGQVPQDEKVLRTLPGVGEYTSKALLCFAFDKQVAVVDTNVRKVILVRFKDVIPDLARNLELDSYFHGNDKEGKAIQQLADQLLPKGKAYEWNQALMDYAGAMLKEHKILTPKQSKFQDSDRFFRGLILRILLNKHRLSLDELMEEIKSIKTIDTIRLEKIVQKMEKDGLVTQNREKFMLPRI